MCSFLLQSDGWLIDLGLIWACIDWYSRERARHNCSVLANLPSLALFRQLVSQGMDPESIAPFSRSFKDGYFHVDCAVRLFTACWLSRLLYWKVKDLPAFWRQRERSLRVVKDFTYYFISLYFNAFGIWRSTRHRCIYHEQLNELNRLTHTPTNTSQVLSNFLAGFSWLSRERTLQK